jgi:hypothetical protein
LSSAGSSSQLNTQAHLEDLWAASAHHPSQQALACAVWCVEHAPDQAAWLKSRIYATLSDNQLKELLFRNPTDGRIQALNLLAQVHQPQKKRAVPPPAPPRAATPVPEETTPYERIFGVALRIVVPAAERTVRIDPEVGRLAIALHLVPQLRLWLVARKLDKQGRGCVQKSDLIQLLTHYGVYYTVRQYRRLFATGAGFFWRQDRQNPERLYLHSWNRVGQILLEKAPDSGYNRPGAYQQVIDVSGSLAAFQGRLYAAWIAYRGREDGVSIARSTLAGLFNRSPRTLRQWERQLGGIIQVRHDYEQHPDDTCTPDELYDIQHHIPDHAQSYTTLTTQGLVQRRRWQRSNTYTSNISAHNHRGQARKVRRHINSVIPAGTDGGTSRINYSVAAHRKRVRSYKFRRGDDGDVMQPVHVYLGQHRVGLYELMRPDPARPEPRTGFLDWRR